MSTIIHKMQFAFCKNRPLQDTLSLFASGITFLFVLPFSVYRLINGDYVMASIDLIIAVGLFVIFVQAWYSLKVQYLNVMIVAFFMLASLGIIYFKTSEMIFWAYPAIIVTYFLLSPINAAFLNCLYIGTVVSFSLVSNSTPAGFYPTLLLVGVFGFIFSIRSEKQTEKLTKLVSEDSLTGIKNRRSFDEKIVEILALNKRSPSPVCLLLLDLDHFKKVNDTHGHKQGDKVLRNFAQTVKSIIRNTDYFYRFGGEEFVIVATNSTLRNTGMLANNIREAIKSNSKLSEFKVTVSIGVSEIKETDNADSWFRRTDLALYQAKESGRDRVFIAGHDPRGVEFFEMVPKKAILKGHPSIKTNNLADEHSGDGGIFNADNVIDQKPSLH